MPHWKLTLAYDGTTFHGWQVQPHLPTIQGTLAAALHDITGEAVLPQGSGRTDAGVHALAQVASVTLHSPIPAANLHRALNRILPPSIRILSAEQVPETFHARLSALQKTYEYRIFERRPEASGTADTDRICPPFQSPYLWDCRFPLNLAAMQQAAADLLGTHNFTSFAASDPDLTQRSAEQMPVILSEGSRLCEPESKDLHEPSPPPAPPTLSAPNPTKTIHAATLHRTPETLTFTITGSGFLHHMVRNIVGTLVEIGRGAFPPNCIPAILAAHNRKAAGPTAPARG
ncbi:MAG: tRNA pseudouridine synthase A, partial [Acidobacteriota bacterium]